MSIDLFGLPATLMDVGAAGGEDRRWRRFSSLRIVGFEPDERAFARLRSGGRRLWLNTALSDRAGRSELFVTRQQTNTSMLPPNMELIRDLAYREEDFEVTSSVEIDCETLDAVCSREDVWPDILKIDTQGSELAILRGASNCLSRSLVAVEIEVEFLPLYRGQPLFADVHAFMTGAGYRLMDLGNLLHVRGRRTRNVGGSKSNLVSGDALYFREASALATRVMNDGEGAMNPIAVACAGYGYPDYALEVMLRAAESTQSIQAWAGALQAALEQDGRGLGRLGRLFNLRDRTFGKLRRMLDRIGPVRRATWFQGLGNR